MGQAWKLARKEAGEGADWTHPSPLLLTASAVGGGSQSAGGGGTTW